MPVGVPRPVFRGLRPPWAALGDTIRAPRRSAETRFQGIATRIDGTGVTVNPGVGRSAETRFQEIAT